MIDPASSSSCFPQKNALPFGGGVKPPQYSNTNAHISIHDSEFPLDFIVWLCVTHLLSQWQERWRFYWFTWGWNKPSKNCFHFYGFWKIQIEVKLLVNLDQSGAALSSFRSFLFLFDEPLLQGFIRAFILLLLQTSLDWLCVTERKCAACLESADSPVVAHCIRF